ncbi:MAG: VRR-NUC domain-containing protein [Syntrophobacteraceae bacterium]
MLTRIEYRALHAVTASARDKARFHAGPLRVEWVAQYPQIFDEQEVRIAANQAGGHFFEWFGAVHLYETTGWLSLVESYQFKMQKWKRNVLQELGASELLRFFDSQGKAGFGRRQAPDLLVYAPDLSEFYFCEVKGPTDRLRPAQIEYFNAMSTAARGKEVVILPVELST